MKINNSIWTIVFMMSFVSCTKVIEVDLNEGSPKHVMEGVLFAGVNDFELRITKTTSYFTPTAPIGVSDAQVTLKDSQGNSVSLAHELDGYYILNEFNALAGESYTLKVIADGAEYTAESVVPEPVLIEELELIEDNIVLRFNDPINTENYYWVYNRIQGEEDFPIQRDQFDDFLMDGEAFEIDLFFEDFDSEEEEEIDPFESGDIIEVELRSIDKSTNDFFITLEEITDSEGGPFGTAPANPTNNWSNGGLGYFGTANSDFEELIIP